MSVRIRLDFAGFGDFVKRAADDASRAVQAGVSAATEGLKHELRQAVIRAGLGPRLANAIGSEVYPRAGRHSLRAAGMVFPRGEGARKIFDAFNQGSTIASPGGAWLAIPVLENMPVLGRDAKPTPGAVEAFFGRRLRFVPPRAAHRRGSALLVLDNLVRGRNGRGVRNATPRRVKGGRGVAPRNAEDNVVMFILVPAARMPKRLDFESVARRWGDRVPELIDRSTPKL